MSRLFGAFRQKIIEKISGVQEMHPSAIKYLNHIGHLNKNTLISEATYIVFDTELTGLNSKKDSIVSIGALKMQGGRIDLNDIYYRVVDPEARLTGKSVVIHEITPSEASKCPKIVSLLPEFLEYCRNGIIVGHFISIDIDFINKDLLKLFGIFLRNPVIDTQKIYKWIRKQEDQPCAFHAGFTEKIDLVSLADKYSIHASNSHHALKDAFVTAQLFQRFMYVLKKFNINTVTELIRIGKP